MRRSRYQPKKTPGNVDPLVARLWQEMEARRLNLAPIAVKAGLAPNSVHAWRRNRLPTLQNLQAVGNAMGLKLVWETSDETLAPF